jgi:hypothetical protein
MKWNVHIIFKKWKVSVQSKLCFTNTTAKYAVPICSILFVFIHSILRSTHARACTGARARTHTHTHTHAHAHTHTHSILCSIHTKQTVLYAYTANPERTHMRACMHAHSLLYSIHTNQTISTINKCSTIILTILHLVIPACHFYFGLRTRMALSTIWIGGTSEAQEASSLLRLKLSRSKYQNNERMYRVSHSLPNPAFL